MTAKRVQNIAGGQLPDSNKMGKVKSAFYYGLAIDSLARNVRRTRNLINNTSNSLIPNLRMPTLITLHEVESADDYLLITKRTFNQIILFLFMFLLSVAVAVISYMGESAIGFGSTLVFMLVSIFMTFLSLKANKIANGKYHEITGGK